LSTDKEVVTLAKIAWTAMQDTTILQKGQVWQPDSLQTGRTDDQSGEK
jgi:hypothetical protein